MYIIARPGEQYHFCTPGKEQSSKCQSQPEAGKALTESRPDRDWWPQITSSHHSLQFCLAMHSLLSATDCLQPFFHPTWSNATGSDIITAELMLHFVCCVFMFCSSYLSWISLVHSWYTQDLYIYVCASMRIWRSLGEHHTNKEVDFFLWSGFRKAGWPFQKEIGFWTKHVVFYFSSLQYSSYRENLQGFSTGLQCSSAELPEGGPGEAFSVALGRLQEGYSDRGMLTASQSAAL